MQRRHFLFTGIAAAAAGSALAAGDEAAVKKAEMAWAEATKKADAAALGNLLASDLTYTHSTGVTDTKKVYIDNLTTGKAKYEVIDYEEMSMRFYGSSTAVLNAQVKLVTVNNGTRGNAHLKFTHVWVKQGGKWLLAAHQSTRLPQ